MQYPYFSIIIPTFNSSETIKPCLESVLNQNYKDFEIIIIDAISSDDTLDIVKSFDDKRIRIISEQDLGVYHAMNKGIDLSLGEWLYFLGSDDRLFNTSVFLEVFNILKNQSYDLVYGNAIFTKQNLVYGGEYDRIKLFTESNICHQAIFYKKDVFLKIGKYNTDFIIYADWDFNIRCFSSPNLRIKFVDQIIAYYNDMSGVSNSGKKDYNFMRVSGFDYERQIQELKTSKDYRLGRIILKPIRLLKKRFNLL